jgi:hypothetical protein
MREALRRFGEQKLVPAEQAIEEDYICPACRGPVFLCRGGVRIAHFSHYPGYGSESCELFVSIHGNGASFQSPSEEHLALASHPSAVALAMRVEDARCEPGWGLALSIPTHGITSGGFTAFLGSHTQRIDLTLNHQSSVLLIATPSHQPYRIENIQPRFGILDARLVKDCSGLREGGTAFGPLGRKRQLIRRSNEIRCGQEYTVVWHDKHSRFIPDSLDAMPLAADGDWRGAKISVPPRPTSDEVRWLEDFLGLGVKEQLPNIVPLWPPLILRRGPQLQEAQFHPEYLYAVDSFTGPTVEIFLKAKDVIGVRVQEPNNALLKIQPGQVDEFKIVARGSSNAELIVTLNRSTPAWRYEGIRLAFADADGIKTWISVFDNQLPDLLQQVRGGLIGLVEATGPKRCSLTVRKRVQGIWKQEKTQTLDTKQIPELLSATIRSSDLDIQLDFGAYGHVFLAKVVRTSEVVALPRRLRAKILSYVFQLPHRPCRLPASDSLTDYELTRVFRRSVPNANSLAHYTAISRALNSFLPNHL